MIAGPGRSGTTLLVQLLDALGFDTQARRLSFSEHAHAGLEADLLAPDPPHVVKDPTLTWRLRSMIETGRVDPSQIECLLVPLRPLAEAVASRIRNTIEQKNVGAPGGMVGIPRPSNLRSWMAEATYDLIQTAARYDVPLIVVEYPRFASDCAYAYRRLHPLLPDVDAAGFESAWRSVVDTQLVRGDRIAVPGWAGLQIAFFGAVDLAQRLDIRGVAASLGSYVLSKGSISRIQRTLGVRWRKSPSTVCRESSRRLRPSSEFSGVDRGSRSQLGRPA